MPTTTSRSRPPYPSATATATAAPTGARVQVGLTASGAPGRCLVEGRHYRVAEVHGHWVSGSAWWLTGVDVDTHTWRVALIGRGGPGARIVDLRCTGGDWHIDRVRGSR